MRIDNPDLVIGDLATSQKLLDYYTHELELRDGVKFHDGKPFTAEDVKASYEYESSGRKVSGAYPGAFEVEVMNRLTCRIHTQKGKYPAIQFWFRNAGRPILSANDIKDPGLLSQRMNGTGPFKFLRHENEETVLIAHEDYFKGRPPIQYIHTIAESDVNLRIKALRSGEADIIDGLESDHIEMIEKEPHLGINSVLSTNNQYLFFRCNKPPFDDWRNRRAACHAIDRRRIWHILQKGAEPNYAHLSPLKFGYVKIPGFPEYNPGLCQKFLSDAGYPNGKGLPELEYIVIQGRYPKSSEYGKVIVEMLNEAGFNVTLSILPAAENLTTYLRGGPGRGHLVDSGWRTESPEPDFVLRFLFHSSFKLITGIQDPEIDKSLDRERHAGTLEERKQILQKETLPLIAKKAPALSLFTSVLLYGSSNALSNYTISPWGTINFERAVKRV